MQHYEASKHWVFKLLLLYFPVASGAYLLYIYYKVYKHLNTNTSLIFLVVIVLTILLLVYMIYIWTSVKYIITEDYFKYQIGFSKKAIKIKDIRFVSKSNYVSVGNRPGLGLIGIKITYGAGRSLFVSPVQIDPFIKQLIEINPQIVIVDSKPN